MSTVFLVQSEPGFWVRLIAPQVHAAGHRATLVTTPLPEAYRQSAAELVDGIIELDDVSDPEVLAATVRAHAADARIITCTDAAMIATTRAAELLGVARLPAAVYAGVRNKYAARQRLRAAGLAGPEVALIQRAEDAAAVAAQVGLPAVVKPMNGAASQLVRVVRTVDELADAYHLLAERLPGSMGGLYDHPIDGLDPTRAFLVESRLDGMEYCMDVVIRDGVVDPLKLVAKPFMDETFLEHVFVCPPFDLPAEAEQRIRTMVLDTVRALGLDNTVAHIELIDDVTIGPAVVEVNIGRPGGGLVTMLNELTSGINLFAECLAATIGDPPPPRTAPKLNIPLAYLVYFGTGRGRLVKIHGLDEVSALPEVLQVVPTIEPGQMLSDDHEVLAVNLIVAGFFDLDELAQVYEDAAKLIRLETEPVDDVVPV